MTLVVFPSKSAGDTAAYSFSFADRLQFGETVTGANVAVAVMSGTDANPNAMLVGSATFNATTVSQDITGGLPGVIYAIVCTVTASNSHNYVKQGSLAVINDAGNYVAA